MCACVCLFLPCCVVCCFFLCFVLSPPTCPPTCDLTPPPPSGLCFGVQRPYTPGGCRRLGSPGDCHAAVSVSNAGSQPADARQRRQPITGQRESPPLNTWSHFYLFTYEFSVSGNLHNILIIDTKLNIIWHFCLNNGFVFTYKNIYFIYCQISGMNND